MPFLNLSTFGAESKGGAPFVVSFTVSDEETKPADIKVTAVSNNQNWFPMRVSNSKAMRRQRREMQILSVINSRFLRWRARPVMPISS
jgi:hypothetical protein